MTGEIITPELTRTASELLARIQTAGTVYRPIDAIHQLPPREESCLPTADQASDANELAGQGFMQSDTAMITVLESDTSTGKSRAAVKAIIEARKMNPDTRTLAVFETHNMVQETVEKLHKESAASGQSLAVEVWRGEDQQDPRFAGLSKEEVEEGRKQGLTLSLMCRRAAARKAARRCGSAESACDGCPFNPDTAPESEACGTKLQAGRAGRERFSAADVVLQAGQSIFDHTTATPLKRHPDWRPVARDDWGQPMRDESGEWKRDLTKQARSERAVKIGSAAAVTCHLDFSHAWIDEITPTGVAVKDTGDWGTMTLMGFEGIAKNAESNQPAAALAIVKTHLQAVAGGAGDSARQANAALEVIKGARVEGVSDATEEEAEARKIKLEVALRRAQIAAAGGAGFTLTAVAAAVNGRLKALRSVLDDAAFTADIYDTKLPGFLTAKGLNDSGLTMIDLAELKSVIWAAKLNVSGSFGEMTPEAIELEGARFADHNRAVANMAGIVTACWSGLAMVNRSRIAAEKAREREIDTLRQRAVYESAYDEAGVSPWDVAEHPEVAVDRMIEAGELPDCLPALGEEDPIPGIEPFIKRVKRKGDGEGEEASEVLLAMVRLATRRKVAPLPLEIPLLITSAERDRVEMQAAFPDSIISHTGPTTVRDGGGVTRMQLCDSLMSKTALVPVPNGARFGQQAENAMRVALDALAVFGASGGALPLSDAQRMQAATFKGQKQRAGLITFKGTREYIEKAMPGASDGFILGHFGAVTGSNAWENSGALTVAGRTSASVRDLERTAAVLAQRPVQRIPADGNGNVMLPKDPETGAEYHPDPMADRVRKSIAEEKLMQGEARGRAARRGADNPITINIATSTPIKRVVDSEFTRDQWRARSGFTAMPLALGVWPAKSEDGEYNLRGWSYQIIGRAGFALLGNETGQLPGVDVNPGLLVSQAADANPTSCSKALQCRVDDSENLAKLVREVDTVLADGETGVRYLVGGSLPFSRDGWHKVELDGNGRTVTVWARGEDAAAAKVRAEAVFTKGIAAMNSTLEDVEDEEEVGRALKAVTAKEEFAGVVAMKQIRQAWSKHRVLGLSARSMHNFAPGIWGGKDAAGRAIQAVAEYHANAPVFDPKTGVTKMTTFQTLSQNCSGVLNRGFIKDPGTLTRTFKNGHPENVTVSEATFLLAAAGDDAGSDAAVLVEFTPDRKGAQKTQLLVKMPDEFARVADEAAVYFDLGQVASADADLNRAADEAAQRLNRLSGKMAEVLKSLESKKEEITAAKSAKAGKTAIRARQAEGKHLRKLRDDLKPLLTSAKAELRSAKKAADAGYQPPSELDLVGVAAKAVLEGAVSSGVKGFRVIHVFRAGLEFDWQTANREDHEAQLKADRESDALGVPRIDPDETPEEAAAALEVAIAAAEARAAQEARAMIESAARVAAHDERMRMISEDYAAHYAELRRMATCPDGGMQVQGYG